MSFSKQYLNELAIKTNFIKDNIEEGDTVKVSFNKGKVNFH